MYLNDQNEPVTTCFGMQVVSTRQGAMYGLSPKDGELDYPDTGKDEAQRWTALVFDDEEREILRRALVSAQGVADDQEAVNFSIKLMELMDAMNTHVTPDVGNPVKPETDHVG